MNSPQKIKFRRIRGRIVPIRIKKVDTEKAVNGAAMTGAGIGISVAAGSAYRKINRVATSKAVKAWRTHESIARKFGPASGSLFSYARKQNAELLAMKAGSAAKTIGRFAAPIRIGGNALGSLLIGAGAAKVVEGVSGRKLTSDETAAIGGGAALGAFITGAHKGAGFRRFIKPSYVKIYPAMRALKKVLKL